MKNENGITILALIVTIVIMSVIGFTVFYSAKGIDDNIDDDILIAELKTVHHIVLQEYNKKLTLGDYILKGVEVTDLTEYNTNLGFELTGDNYYKLLPSHLEAIGAKNATSSYLVCYETGEVANISTYKTSDGEPLYTK
ncbi:MAG: hypothetical protein IKT41_05635 [Clostridia bacterium]|nr:hypothetical protein [Clostridia bacterium]